MNFDEIVDRSQYPAMKWSPDFLAEHFGNENAIPLSVADMAVLVVSANQTEDQPASRHRGGQERRHAILEIRCVPERPLGIIAIRITEGLVMRFACSPKERGELFDFGFVTHGSSNSARLARTPDSSGLG